jgi:hypothetical protein
MKKYENKIIPESVKKVLVKTTCDMCGGEIKTNGFDYDEVEISREHGSVYPEGGFTDTDFIDLCGKCFQEKLIPWLKSQGCEIQTKDTGF